jgi:autoinducer 2 (AI-2) kinase
MDRMDEMLEHSDFISLHVPLVPETKGLIGAHALARMKPGAVLINAARAHIVDKDALIDALRSGHLAGVGLDVFWHEPVDPHDPIFECPNVVATPHGGGTKDLRENMARVVAENIRRVRSGISPMYLVDA